MKLQKYRWDEGYIRERERENHYVCSFAKNDIKIY